MALSEVVFESVPCNFCGSRSFDIVLHSTVTLQDLRQIAKQTTPQDAEIKSGRIVRCRKCGLCYVHPRPSADLLKRLYEKTRDPSITEEMPHQMKSASFFLKKMEKFSPGRRLLDIGCYTGFFLKAAQKQGWEVEGIEPSEWAARYAREELHLPVKVGTLEKSSFQTASFDTVTLFHVLEHVVDPLHFLEKVHTLLAPGGLVVIEVPDIESLAARILKRRWYLLKAVHLTYFSSTTLSKYLGKAGFQILWKGRAAHTFRLGHLAGRLSPYLGKGSEKLAKGLEFLKLSQLSVPINLGDLLLVYARKR